MPRRIDRLVPLVLLVGAAGLIYGLWSKPPAAEPIWREITDGERNARDPIGPAQPPQGGVYAGHVVDMEDRPIHGASVLLVAYNAGDLGPAAGDVDPETPPVVQVGDRAVAGEAITGPDGAFRIAADSQSRISQVLAWDKRHFINGVDMAGRAREGIVIRLAGAGRVVGRVVDDVTGEPVSSARVDIFLQNITAAAPTIPEGKNFGEQRGRVMPLSPLVQLGRFIPMVLGPRVWELHDIPQLGEESLKVFTNAEGHFELGPFGDGVQLEFVITHDLYKWYDFDTNEGTQAARRTVVKPGETVDREFRLRRGEEVSGQVLDEHDQPVADVRVGVTSISQYFQHPWYRHKQRMGRTDLAGRFHVQGLGIGAQQIAFYHPSFGVKYETVQAGAANLIVHVDSFGALRATLSGLPARRSLIRRAQVTLESTEDNPRGARQVEQELSVDSNEQLLMDRILPGRYRVWAVCERMTSQPQDVEIVAHKTVDLSFTLGGGGGATLRVMDEAGRFVDPSTARLYEIRDSGPVGLGTFVSREGVMNLTDLVPGRYFLEVSAGRYLTQRTEEFQVREGDTVPLAPISLRRYAWLRFLAPVDEGGKVFVPRPNEEVVLEWRQGGDTEFTRIHTLQYELPVPPGPVEIRARADRGVTFDLRLDLTDGQRQDVQVVLRPGS